MAQVRAIRICQVDNSLRQEGDVFEYNGPENGNLEYLDGKPAKAQVETQVEDDAPAETSGKKWTPKAKRASAE
jgi:hypothetical protein